MALFTPDFVERVRSANDLSQVAAGYNVQLRRAGANMLGLCPFHNEKTPSFNIRAAEQYFRCFGCGAKGDVFRFIQLMEKVEFPEAVRMLAERAGLPLEYESPAAAREAERRGDLKRALLWCCSRALDYFEESLRGPAGAPAREYLAARGFDRETIAKWRLGWAPRDGLIGFLLKNSKETFPKEKVLEYAVHLGLLKMGDGERGGGRYYDAFRSRVMFPILDIQARPIAFGGRVLETKPEGFKYINSPESRLFEKRKVLFGLCQAAKEISVGGEAVLVEGYTDVVMCHQYGVSNVVAPLGTALTEEHVALLGRYVANRVNGRVVAFFDSDQAGRNATRKAVALFMERDVPLAVAPGLEVKDAGEFLPRFGAEAFKQKLAGSEDSFTHLLHMELGYAKSRDVLAVGQAVREIMRIVNLCPDPVKRALMRRRVSAEAGVPEETLPRPEEKKSAFPAGTVSPAVARPAAKRGLTPPTAGMEMEDALRRARGARRRREARLLRYMWDSPEWCGRIADKYPPDEWRDQALAELAALARDEWGDNRGPSINGIRARVANPETAERLADLAFPDNEPLSEKELSRILSLVLDENRKEEIRLLLAEMEAAQKRGDADREAELLAEYTRLQALRKTV